MQIATGWLTKHPVFSAALALGLVLNACFFPFIWGNKTLLASARGETSITPNGAFYGRSDGPAFQRANDMDAAAWLPEPLAALVHEQYRREKRLPLWNPYQSYGAPLAANMQSQPFYPLFVLFSLHPGPRTFNYFVLCRLFLIGLLTYLYLRMFVSFAASLGGGIACMLSGYFILFLNMPELSVSLLIPAVFLATERLLRRPDARSVALSAVITCLCVLGGMPESTFLALVFGGLYFLFRLTAGPPATATRIRQVKHFALAQILGLALAAFLLVPFFEFMSVSFDTHQPANTPGRIAGLVHDRFGLSIFTYVVPMLFRVAWRPLTPDLGGLDYLRGFMGVVQVLFAVVAITGLASKTASRFTGERALTLFFLLSAVAVILKRYGAPVINWAGSLPFCRYILFRKYDEPLLAFAIAVLCAFGVQQVLNGASRRRLAASFSIMFAILGAAALLPLREVLRLATESHVFYLSLAEAIGMLFVTMLIVFGPAQPASRRWLSATLLIVLTADMAGNYTYPVYYVLTNSAGDDANPYRGAPYIDYLKAHTGDHERIFARRGVLQPDWASTFQLSDIRGLDALYYRKYRDLVRYLLRDEIPPHASGDLIFAFTGTRWRGFDNPSKSRLLQLSSVKYLVSPDAYGLESGVLPEIFRQNAGRLFPGRETLIEIREFTIAGEKKEVLYEHPPYDRLPLHTAITAPRQKFSFSVAMAPAVYDGTMPMCGDGVEFRLEARDNQGRIDRLFDRYIDPKHNPAERRWIDASVDLRAYLGQEIDLLFTTTGGPAGNTCADWAGWGDPRFADAPAGPPPFDLVYDREVKIYEYRESLPRAALYSDVEVAADEAAVLRRLGDPSLNIFQTAVVSAANLNLHGSHKPVQAARIVSYDSQQVEIDASPDGPALLVLNDSDYPGWKAYLDGHRATIITANYLFRGVLLDKGRHRVRFAYEPASYVTGGAISGVALLGLAGFCMWPRRKDSPTVPTP